MIKYEVTKELIEIEKPYKILNAADLIHLVNYETDREQQIVAVFETPEEAERCFAHEKEGCCSRIVDGYSYPLILFDYLELQKNEYDEDGEFQSSEIWDSFAAPIEYSTDELFDDVSDYAEKMNYKPGHIPGDVNFIENEINKYIDEKYNYLVDFEKAELIEEVLDYLF